MCVCVSDQVSDVSASAQGRAHSTGCGEGGVLETSPPVEREPRNRRPNDETVQQADAVPPRHISFANVYSNMRYIAIANKRR